MICYRIYTESTPEYEENIERILTQVTPGFTLIPAKGYWKGIPEKTVIIEIIDNEDMPLSPVDIRLVAERIRIANKQEAVLFTSHFVNEELVTGE